MMKVDQYKVAILFYMLIVLQVQPEFKQDHNHEHHHKHPHDHDHDHHRRSEIRKASRIYNGRRTPFGRAKFMAAMVKNRSDNHCSAVIITGDMLLTAAHCLDNESNADLQRMRIIPNAFPIQIYRDNPQSDHPLIKRIRTFWIHPRYKTSPNTRYDIAIMQIGPQPWQLGPEVDAALMPVRVRHLDLRVIKGYGFGHEVDEISPAYLNEVSFRYYWNEALCEVMFGFQRSLQPGPNVIFCVSNWSPDPGRNPMFHGNVGPGDSGGGILIKGSVRRLDSATRRNIIKTGFVLAGIVAKADIYYFSIANRQVPNGVVTVNVTTMMPWINSIVRVDFETYPFTPF